MSISHLSFGQKSWRLSPMYFFYFMLFGAFVPYIARFLTASGLTPHQASIVVAVVNGVNVFAPFLFSYFADRSGKRMIFIRMGYVGIGVFYLLSLLSSGFLFYLITFGLFGVCLSAVLPQMESITLAVLGSERKRYGQVRFWGSIGFVMIVWVIGFLLDVFSVRILPIIGGIITVLMFVSTFLIPERKAVSADPSVKSVEIPTNTKILWGQLSLLLVVVLLWQFGMAPYNTFFDLYLSGQGFSGKTIGFLISFGSLCEIGIFIYISRLFSKYSERALMSFALLVTAIRWLLLYTFADSFIIVLLSQTMHAVTFGMVHSVVVHRIGHLVPAGKASFGQGLYVAFGAGAGLFFGNIFAGFLWNGSGLIYVQAALWTLLALVITWFGFKDDVLVGTDK